MKNLSCKKNFSVQRFIFQTVQPEKPVDQSKASLNDDSKIAEQKVLSKAEKFAQEHPGTVKLEQLVNQYKVAGEQIADAGKGAGKELTSFLARVLQQSQKKDAPDLDDDGLKVENPAPKISKSFE